MHQIGAHHVGASATHRYGALPSLSVRIAKGASDNPDHPPTLGKVQVFLLRFTLSCVK